MNIFRAALASDFWITGVAIARYIPRAFRVKQVDGDPFFTDEKRQEYRRRVESVTPDSRRQWGNGVHLSYDKMVSFLAQYGNQDALKVAQDLDHKVEKLLNDAAVE